VSTGAWQEDDEFENGVWQPRLVRQYSSVAPQKPCAEQQGETDGQTKPFPEPDSTFPQVLFGLISWARLMGARSARQKTKLNEWCIADAEMKYTRWESIDIVL
jgi:hypothetical protein